MKLLSSYSPSRCHKTLETGCHPPHNISLTGWWVSVAMLATSVTISSIGCLNTDTTGDLPDHLWGRRGIAPGRLMKPRALAIDAEDRLYLVDTTGRIQVFDVDGKYLHGWRTPDIEHGRPTGLHISAKGRLLVADTHYYRVLAYRFDGELDDASSFGGTLGSGPGEFGFVTDVVDDSNGNFYVAEYGEWDRVQKFSAEGKFLLQWGSHGSEPGQFRRPQSLAIDDQNRIWVADACNHRIQVFNADGHFLWTWGEQGSGPGQLYYPYGLTFDDQGNVLVCEYGNHRIQKFTAPGKPIGCWGTHGRQPGQLHNPWSLARDSLGRIHVIDSNNHRVQRIVF